MSTPRYCGVWKASDGKWYLDLADSAYPEDDEYYDGPLGGHGDSTTYGPFGTQDAAIAYLDNFSNPGSFYTDDSGKGTPPKKSPNGKPVGSPTTSRWGGYYESRVLEVLTKRFGPPLMTEGFGTPVDNTWNRVGIEDERDKADTSVHPGTFWSQFQQKRPKSVKN